MENACVIGWGVVGQATGNLFGIKKHFDTDENKSNISLDSVARCRFVFICIPTPFDDAVGYRTDDIVSLIKQIEEYGSSCLYIIRSTVWPGFANHVMSELGIDSIVSNPEFLTEATAEKDSKNPPFVLLGSVIPRYLQEVQGFYEGRIKGAPVILTDNISAELAKLALNGFFSTKVIYANAIYDYAQQIGANYERVKDILERHPFGFKNHSTIWFKGKRGVHGKCLPKDLKALGYYSAQEFIQKANQLNENYIYLKEEE